MIRNDDTAAEVTNCAFAALGERHWRANQFTASVPMMVATLRNLKPGQLFMPQSLIDYAARGMIAPRFKPRLRRRCATSRPIRKECRHDLY